MHRKTAQQQFDAQAAHYDQQWNRWSEENLRWLVEHAGLRGAEEVLDVATGAGFTALAFAPRVARVTGLDVSEKMLEQARQNARKEGAGNFAARTGAAEAMPFPDASFDIVVCRMAAHHFESVPAFLTESLRVLRPGGRLLIADTTVPDDDAEIDAWQNRAELLRDNSHKRNYSPREWAAFVSQAGLLLEAMDTTGGSVPITFEAWLKKGGCKGEAAEEVRRMFTEASDSIRRAFGIVEQDGDISFHWQRVVLAASKRSW
jgi:ubiquinone/menaquinone biosynthesis C-methylase UbiE